MKTFLVGVGAAGNKAVVDAVQRGTVDVEDTCIVNSTTKDFPAEYEGKKICLTDSNTGCGKERAVAKELIISAISAGKLNIDLTGYITVCVVTSVEGGTGSGSAPIIAKFFNEVANKNVHIIAFTGFEEDVRGLSNTVEFFKEIGPNIVVQTISNASYLAKSGNNRLKAEEMANEEMAERIEIITGKNFIPGKQNIDDTDILKLSNTAGYMVVSKKYFNKPLETRDDFEKIIKHMIYNNSSVKTEGSAARLGVILNISPESEDAVDFMFESLRKAYGSPYEFFKQEQWDGKKEYIAFIASGLKMPIEEIKAVYDRYKEQSEKVNKASDPFFSEMQSMSTLSEDSKFDMIKDEKSGTSVSDFLSQLAGK